MNHGTRPGSEGASAAAAAGGANGRHAGRSADLHNPATSSNLTVDGTVHVGEDTVRKHGTRSSSSPPSSARAGGNVQKICCSCGKNVANEERFKDRAGFYWCMDCGVQENRKNHTIAHALPEPVKCPDCEESFQPDQLVERDHVKVCGVCAEKRDKFAEHEAARQAARRTAAMLEAAEAERHRRRMLIAAAAAAAVALAGAVYVIAF